MKAPQAGQHVFPALFCLLLPDAYLAHLKMRYMLCFVFSINEWVNRYNSSCLPLKSNRPKGKLAKWKYFPPNLLSKSSTFGPYFTSSQLHPLSFHNPTPLPYWTWNYRDWEYIKMRKFIIDWHRQRRLKGYLLLLAMTEKKLHLTDSLLWI